MKTFPLALSSALIFVVISALPAQAGEIFGSVGYGRFSRDEGFGSLRKTSGFGPTYGAGIGAHPLPLLGFEFTLHGMQHSRERSTTPANTTLVSVMSEDGRPLFLSGNILLHFSGGLVQPYVVGGIGVMHYDGTSRVIGGVRPGQDSTHKNEFAMNFGAGMKIFVVPKVSLRPEIRYFTSRPHNFNMMQASIGLSLHW